MYEVSAERNKSNRVSSVNYRLLDSLVVECWLRVREVPGSIPSHGPRPTKDVIKMVPVVPLYSTEHSKGKYWLSLKNYDRTKIVMDKILGSRRSLAVVAGMKNKTMTRQKRKKSNTNTKKTPQNLS